MAFPLLFSLALRKMSVAGGGQLKGKEELALDTRYGKRCSISGRGRKGLLPVLRAFLLSKGQHFLRQELILAGIRDD